MKNANKIMAESLIKRRLKEAVGPGFITAEKVPSGGNAGPMGGGEGGEGGGEGPVQKTITITCGEEECDAVVQALSALKTAGANISATCDGEECNLCGEKEGGENEGGDEPPAPDGTSGHEGAEGPAHEEGEKKKEGEDE